MKRFFKTIGYGLIHVFMSVMVLFTTAAAYHAFFINLPASMGIGAVGMFILGAGLVILSGLIIYALGFNMAKVNEEKENVQ